MAARHWRPRSQALLAAPKVMFVGLGPSAFICSKRHSAQGHAEPLLQALMQALQTPASAASSKSGSCWKSPKAEGQSEARPQALMAVEKLALPGLLLGI